MNDLHNYHDITIYDILNATGNKKIESDVDKILGGNMLRVMDALARR